AVHGVRHAALLADLLEEARRGGAAENRVEDRCRETATVAAGDARRTEPEVLLLGVLPLKPEARCRRLDERPPNARRRARRLCAAALGALEQREQPLVRDVACRRDDDVRAGVHRAVIPGDRAPA